MTIAAGLLAGCGGGTAAELERIAVRTCGELDGAIVLQVGPILSGAIAEAEAAGASAPELGDAMRAECPGLMAAVESIGEEDAAEDALAGDVERTLTVRCLTDGASGTVENPSDRTITVILDVQFTTRGGTLVDSSGDVIDGLRPGQTARWEASFFGSNYDRCEVSVDSAYFDD